MRTLDEQIEHQRGVVATEDQTIARRAASTASTPAQLNAVSAVATRQRDYLDELLARQAGRDKAVATHQAAEAQHADELVLLGHELEDSRREVADKVSAAIAAMDAAYSAAEDLEKLLANRSAWLRSVGLPARFQENHDEEARFATGGFESTALGRPHLQLAGQPWPAVHPQAVMQYVVAAVIASHQYVGTGKRTAPVHQLLDPLTRRPQPMPPGPASAGWGTPVQAVSP